MKSHYNEGSDNKLIMTNQMGYSRNEQMTGLRGLKNDSLITDWAWNEVKRIGITRQYEID